MSSEGVDMVETTNNTEMSKQLLPELKKHLDAGNTKDALNLIEHERFSTCLKDYTWDIIPLISNYLTNDYLNSNPELFECCETLLLIIAETCDPSEALLEFIEQAECPDNDTKFIAILKPMAATLQRLPGHKERSLEWCINTIKAHIAELPFPGNEKLEGEEMSLLDSDPNVVQIVRIYQEIMSFFDSFVTETSLQAQAIINTDYRKLILSTFISFLGEPFCYLELKAENSERRSLAATIMRNITRLTGDLFRYLSYVEVRMINQRHRKPTHSSRELEDTTDYDIPRDLFSRTDTISNLAYANMYYLILATGLQMELVPNVYEPIYVLHNCLYLSSLFLAKAEYILINKGLALAKAAIVRIETSSVGPDVLELEIYINFVTALSQIMIYCDVQTERQSALNVFQLYLQMFTLEAKYLLLVHLYDIIRNSGFLGFITSVVKDCIAECLKFTPVDTSFTGKHLHTLVRIACRMPFESVTDLVEAYDEIVSSLNLIRFLVIRDKVNVTGIWDYVKEIENSYLNPLRKSIDMSRAHYQLKIKDLEAQQNLNQFKSISKSEQLNEKLSITVGGETLPEMPIGEKINFCHRAMNAFDIIESILIRVNECIENNLKS